MVNEKVLAQGRVLYIADDITGHRLNSDCIVKVERTFPRRLSILMNMDGGFHQKEIVKIKNRNIHLLVVHFVWELVMITRIQ